MTILFCDLAGSTALGHGSDPEALSRRMHGYYERMREIVERHGGVVEKFVGDAVMAVFGIPRSHEDDAVRALRAAGEMRVAVGELGLEARIGINTGPVVAGESGSTLVTGDAVNVAARLEQHAAPGQILLGSETRNLVRDAITAEPIELTVKGKSEPLAAHRLVELDMKAAGFARRLHAPLVGRTRERRRLRDEFEDAVAEQSCRLFTLLGVPGVGKSRLVADFVAGADARIVSGRCLSYGDGITYAPLVEVALQLGADPREILGSTPAETQLAFRRLLEASAAERPLIVVLDDLQWAEETFLDLVEHIVDWSRGAPLFLLCLARPELLDMRAWSGGKANASSILLEPLQEANILDLVDALPGGSSLSSEVRDRIVEAAQGNPLFVEEMVARADAGDDTRVPPTIHALLEARLDRLSSEERAVVDRGAVEGEIFHRGPLAATVDHLDPRLVTLVRQDVIRPAPAQFQGDDAFRFRHILLRDAAYEAIAKKRRAELHEQFAAWVDENGGLLERDEIVGLHLEQAALYLAELDEPYQEVATRAAMRLAGAMGAAANRSDFAAARKLGRRGWRLTEPLSAARAAFVPQLFRALTTGGEWEAAQEVIDDLRRREDDRSRAYGVIFADELAGHFGSDPVEMDADAIRSAFVAADDELGLAVLARHLGSLKWIASRVGEAAPLYAEAAVHASRAGWTSLAAEMQNRSAASILLGPLPLEEYQRFAAEAGIANIAQRARVHAMLGEIDRAWETAGEAQQDALERGDPIAAAASAELYSFVGTHGGREADAVPHLAAAIEELERLGAEGSLSMARMELATILEQVGRLDEAEKCLAHAAASPALADLPAEASLRSLLAAHRGDEAEAAQAATRAVEIADATDFFVVRASAHVSAARTYGLLDRGGDARSDARTALTILEAKGDVAWSAQVRGLLDEL